MSDIKEGDDVYFECDIEANPKVDRVRWFHEVGYVVLAWLVCDVICGCFFNVTLGLWFAFFFMSEYSRVCKSVSLLFIF